MNDLDQHIRHAVLELHTLGYWSETTTRFLQRPASLSSLEAIVQETACTPQEAVLLLLAAIRYIDLRGTSDPSMQTLLEESIRDYNLDLFLARYHPQIMQLATHRHIQANLPARALPILEVLSECTPDQNLALIELGCAAGNLGIALLNAPQVCTQALRYFPIGQQLPKATPIITWYRGYDLDIPDPTWVLACVSSQPERERLASFMGDMPTINRSKNFQVHRADALHFPKLPGLDLDTTQTPIIITSFMCYQLPHPQRPALEQAIIDYTLKKGGHWLDMDLVPRAEGGLEFVLRMDGHTRIVLHDDYCITWSWLEGRSR